MPTKLFIEYFIMLMFIINLLFFKISCDECSCEGGNENECLLCNKCKFFYQDNSCIECQINSESSYYTKDDPGEDSDPSCSEVSIENLNEYKLIYGKKEVASVCPDGYYELGNICYDSQPQNSVKDPENLGKYICEHSFYIESKDGFNYYTCFSENCPLKFKYYSTTSSSSQKQCLTSCEQTIKKEQNGDSFIYRCSEKCDINEVEYEKGDDDNTIKYCLGNCPSEAKYKKEIGGDPGYYKCVESCDNGQYSENGSCVNGCDTKIVMDITQKTYECSENCPNNFPYSYEKGESTNVIKYCLKSCNDTNNENLFPDDKEITYLYEENNERKCLKEAPNGDGSEVKYYKDEAILKWVTDCKLSPSGPFHDEDSCKTSCEGFDCSTNDDFKCINIEEEENYYLDKKEKICYKDKCPDYLGKSFYYINKTCTSCSNGFYKYASEDRICYTSYEDITSDVKIYINNGENYFFENGCNNNPLYKYYKKEDYDADDNKIICYQSCFNISDAKFEKDNICFSSESQPTDIEDYYFYTIKKENDEDFTKYTKNQNDCIQAGFPYLNGNTMECISNCEHYKILPTQNILGKCCTELDICKNETFKYYNETNKIISDKCKEFIVVNKDREPITEEENCLDRCSDELYEDFKNKLCYKECESYTEKSGKKIYVENCDSFYYIENGNEIVVKKCVEVCGKKDGNNEFKYTYYDLESLECTDTCPKDGDSDKFSYDTKDNHQPCLNSCEKDEYYYKTDENPKICLKKCNDYYNKDDEHICEKNCGNNEYIHPGNICSSNPCPTNAPFFYSFEINNDPELKNINCTTNCKENGYDYYNVDYGTPDISPNQCLLQCQGFIYNGGCYKSCPEGLYISKNDNDENNYCVSNCPKYFVKNGEEKYECTNSCEEEEEKIYLTSSGECVKKCPQNEIFIGQDNKCLSSCENDINKFYEEITFDSDADDKYKNYKCINSCSESESKKKYIYGTKECIEECEGYYLYENGNEKICYKNCILNKDKSFSTEKDGEKICWDECLKENEKNFFLNDKICKNGCNTKPYNIINDFDGSCVNKCNLTSEYKFLQVNSNDDSSLHCKKNCDTQLSTLRYLKSNYICIDKCEHPNNYVVEDGDFENANECLSKCPANKSYMRENNNDEYICSNTPCEEDDKYYYNIDTNICLVNCDSLYLFKNDTKKYCLTSCDYISETKLYFFEGDEGDEIGHKECVEDCKETSKQYSKMNGHCDKKCDKYEFHNKGEFICLPKCPFGTKIQEENECVKCEDLEPKQYIDENGNCVEKCETSNTGYKYHKKDEYDCLNNCSNQFIEDFICKDSCESKMYKNDKICSEVCPPNKRFFLENGDKTCLVDCPKNYRFYTVDSEENLYVCTENCGSYIPNINPKINATLCLGNNCNENYTFYINDEDNKKICYSQCPSSMPYFIEEEENNGLKLKKCYEQCEDGYIHMPNDNKCILHSECNGQNKIKLKEKECVEKCSKTDKIFEKGQLIYCVEKCDEITRDIKDNDDNLLLTNDNKCVSECPQYSESNGTFCVCPRLFYYDEITGFKNCLNELYTLCEDTKTYPIMKMNTNECTKYCDGILSLSGYECYNNSYQCKENETLTTSINGEKKCDCIDKFYINIENEKEIKKCLGKNEECPSDYPLLIKETKECVKECPTEKYNIEYGKTCVTSCPTNDEIKLEGNKCVCSGKWYASENYEVICTKECPDFKSLYVEAKKECVSTCKGTGSEIYFNKTCIQTCDGKTDRKIISSENEPLFANISSSFCGCEKAWYTDNNEYDICIEDCNSEGYKFKNIKTNRCINSCPKNYYIFNNECYLNCENDKIVDEKNKMCKCPNTWKYIDEKRTIIECINLNTLCEEGFLYVNNTKECYYGNKCPKDYPVNYKNKCYAINDCPKDLNTVYDEINQKCACIGKWLKDSLNEICLSENANCPDDYQFFNHETKECQKSINIEENSNSPLLYEFNYGLYSNCPINTTRDGDSMKCICDPLLGYWYKNQSLNGKIFMICAQEKCPDEKKYNVYKEKECISICPNENQFLYQNMCYKKCPDLTEVIGNTNECQMKTEDNEINLQNLEKVMTENIVDLYKKSTNFNSNKTDTGTSVIPGQKIVTQNATVEFYGVNKKNKGQSSQNIKSDLSYIDISDCIDKIYSSHKIDKDADIVILKFDVNKVPDQFLINPVEYKFINSKTGKEIDASICEHNSIKISYPVHDLISKYDKMMRNMRKLEYMRIGLISNNKDSLREKLDKGKEINEDYPDTDIFNINSKIYTDICIAVEVDGKDLVLEDRVNYFYPQLSLCENNCTYNHTDFQNERIFCDCSFKTEFDFDREYTSSFELNTNQIKNDQSGNSNVAVMKCVSNLNNPKSISKNGGFIYSLIILFIEFILLLIISIYGIRVLSNKLQNKMKKNEESEENDEKNENEEKEEVNIMNTNDNKKTEENLKSSERNLNSPPKKKENFGMEFIPPEYVFLFFNQGDKDIIKKVERDSVPFKTKLNTRILLEQKKNINYDNIKPRGPFPPEQNVLVIVDSMDDDINDYLDLEGDISQEQENNNNKNILKSFKNTFNQTKMSKKSKQNKNEKDSLKINQKPKLYKRKKTDFSITDYDPSDENYSIYDIDEEEEGSHEKGLIEIMKANQRLIKRDYDIVIKNKKPSFIEILATEIIDKIYITKILFFTRKFEIFSLQLSVYLLCHLLLLVFNTLFFDVKIIRDIWAKESYPGLGFYLGYGFLACLIVWVIYKVFLCLLTNNDKIKELLKLIHFNNKYEMNREKNIDKKYNNLIWKVKFKFTIYTFIEFLLLILGFLYLSVFCSVYTGTQSKIFKAYGIALIEILIIKILYGIALAIMRHISLSKQKKGLYKVVIFMDTYLV